MTAVTINGDGSHLPPFPRRPPPFPELSSEPDDREYAVAATNFYLWLRQEYPKWEARDVSIERKLDVLLERRDTSIPRKTLLLLVVFQVITILSSLVTVYSAHR